MFKKKQVKRSEWFEGLLWAEGKVQDGYHIRLSANGWIDLIRDVFDVRYHFEEDESFHAGVIDYIEYKEKTNV